MQIRPFPSDILGVVSLAQEWGGDRPTKRILNLLRRLACLSYVVTEDFVNPELEAEHDLYYRHSSIVDGPAGQKIDFFSQEIKTEADLDTLPDDAFLGYLVLRPLPGQRVCEAVIRSDTNDRPQGHYVLSKEKFYSTVGEREFSVVGTPFMQQDGGAGVCGHASILTIAAIMTRTHPGTVTTGVTITDLREALAEVSGSSTPGPGVETVHVARAFEYLGLSGETFYDFTDDVPRPVTAEQIAYLYTEAGLPVYLGIPTLTSGHSLVIVGHTFERDAWWPEAAESYYRRLETGEVWLSSAAWVGHFIIHDDNFGPYLAMPKQIANVSLVAVPLPRTVLLKGENAEHLAFWKLRTAKFLSILQESIDLGTSPWSKNFEHHLTSGRLVLRPILLEREVFLAHVERNPDVDEVMEKGYRELDLPDWLWVIELSIPEIFGAGYRLGEVILDAQYPWHLLQDGIEACKLIHVPGVWWKPLTDDPLFFKEDTAYTVIDRRTPD